MNAAFLCTSARLVNLRHELEMLSEPELVEFSKTLEESTETSEEALRLRADMKAFIGILIFTKREITDRCLPPADQAYLAGVITGRLIPPPNSCPA